MLAFSFAYRYLRSKKSANAVNIISWVSLLAISLGTAALVLVMSVFNGFDGMVKDLYGTFYPDLRVIPDSGKFLSLQPQQLQQLLSINGIRSASPVIEERAILQNGSLQSIVTLKGVPDQYSNTTSIHSSVYKGRFDLGDTLHPGLVTGAGIDMALGLEPESAMQPVTVYLAKPGTSALLSPDNLSTGMLMPNGSFAIQDDFNNKYAFTRADFLQNYLGLSPSTYTALELAVHQPALPSNWKEQILSIIGKGVVVQTRYEQNQSLYAAIKLEKWVIYGVLVLIMIIFSFTVISAISMLVLEKQQDLGLLKAMGARNGFIRNIFLGQGLLLSVIGAVTGMFFSLSLCFLQQRYKFIKLAGNSFLIDYYPVKVVAADLLIIFATVVLIVGLASWIPATKAALRKPELRGAD